MVSPKPRAMQDAIGEHVAAVEIARDLDFIDGDELYRPIERHRLDRADEIARAFRGDLLFAGDQRRRARPLAATTRS